MLKRISPALNAMVRGRKTDKPPNDDQTEDTNNKNNRPKQKTTHRTSSSKVKSPTVLSKKVKTLKPAPQLSTPRHSTRLSRRSKRSLAMDSPLSPRELGAVPKRLRSTQAQHDLEPFVPQPSARKATAGETDPPALAADTLPEVFAEGEAAEAVTPSGRPRILSHELYSSPQRVSELLEDIKRKIDDYGRIQMRNDWVPLIHSYHRELIADIAKVSQHVVVNNLTDSFITQIESLTESTEQTKIKLMKIAEEPEPVMANAKTPGSLFRARYTRSLDPNTIITVEGDSARANSSGSGGFHGYEVETIERRVERLEDGLRHAKRQAKIMSSQVAQAVDTGAQLAVKLQNTQTLHSGEAQSLQNKTLDISQRLDTLEAYASQAKADNRDLLERLERIEGANLLLAFQALCNRVSGLENSPLPGEIGAMASRIAKLETQSRPISLEEMDRHISNAIARSIPTRGQVAPPAPSLNGREAGTAPGPVPTAHEKKVLMEIDVLRKLTKDLKAQVSLMERPHSNGTQPTMMASTPIQESRPNTSLLGSEFAKRSLERMMLRLEKATASFLTEDADIAEVRKKHDIDLPTVKKTLLEFSKGITDYCKGDPDSEFYTQCIRTSDMVESWIEHVETAYDKRNIHSVITDKDRSGAVVRVFKGDHTQTVYEFLEDFENAYLTVGTSKRRANILHREFLDEWIRIQTLALSNDYPGLKSWLMEKYGAPEIVSKGFMDFLESLRRPASNDSERLTFFLAISNVLTRVERLGALPQLERLKGYMRSYHIMERLVNLLPKGDDPMFMQTLRDHGLSTHSLQGDQVMQCFQEFIISRVDDLKRSVEREMRTNPQAAQAKAKGALTAAGIDPSDDNASSASESEDEHFGYGKASANLSASDKQKPSQWWTNGLSFPCPITGHNHEIAACQEYLMLTPTARRKVAYKNGHFLCWACVRPTSICKKSCANRPLLPEILRCSGCKPFAASKNMSALCILFCTNEEHGKDRPSQGVVYKELKKYLKGIPKGLDAGAIVVANAAYIASCNCQPALCNHTAPKTSPPDPSEPIPIIDTHTGTRHSRSHIQTISEPTDDAFFLMQWIRIGSSKCLVLFDRGSNVNLIDGDLAEREQLKVVSNQSSGVMGIGGAETGSQYGRYKVILGSAKTGTFHELECCGMDEVTGKFSTYPLSQINKQALDEEIVDRKERLPPSVGGGVVSLLIGIRDITLDPKCIGTLSCGTGVFRSPLTDIHGSTICYGGPNPVFSSTNIKSGNLVAASMLVRDTQNLIDSIYGWHSPFSHNAYTKVNPNDPFPLNDSGTPIDPPQDGPCAEDQILGEVASCCAGAHLCSVNKALIPISKLRELVDQDDVDDVVTFRCPTCSKCVTCKQSSKMTATSIQNSVEHAAIKGSIHIDLEAERVWVDLPFIRDPVPMLRKQHGGNDNHSQAMKVYQAQCRKSDAEKISLRAAHAQLVDQGFITPLTALAPAYQQIIRDAEFRHFMIWRGQGKEDSPSTPCRIIVDPTMSGLNLCLPKGENRLGRINEIIIRTRISKYLWATDISKMYNQLALRPTSYPYQLLLYTQSLDPSEDPETWVMVTAWYGMVPTGNQAGEAIAMLLEQSKEQYPLASHPLTHCRYVDDVTSGADTLTSREAQIEQVRGVLAKGGFKLKFIVRSGEKPCDKASQDGKTLKLLGYKYTPELDTYAPGFTEINPNRRVRGVKKSNNVDVSSPDSALSMLKQVRITRKICMSLLAEFFDPVGIFEPLKLQYKIALSTLNSYDYKETLPDDCQQEWRERLSQLSLLPSISVPRLAIPSEISGNAPIRLICLSDAGEKAGGAAIYAGAQLGDGSFSCQLLTARSKLLKATIPRNELTAVMLMAELAFVAKRAIGHRVAEVIYLTDSTIALSWCQNTSLKLRMFVYNRVESIRRLIQWTGDSEEIPLYHIQGTRNLADLVTKPLPLTFESVDGGSEWQNGSPWMRLPTKDLPCASYKQINLSAKGQKQAKQECFDDPFFLADKQTNHSPLNTMIAEHSLGTSYPSLTQIAAMSVHGPGPRPVPREPLLLDIVALGWFRSTRIIGSIIHMFARWKHSSRHVKKGVFEDTCILCTSPSMSDLTGALQTRAEQYLFREESSWIKQVLPKSKINKFVEIDGVLHLSGRLSEENPFRFRDLDSVPFLDAHEFTGLLPVVMSDSPIFFAFLMAIHTKIMPHAGVITTMREVSKKMFVPNAPKRIVAKVRADCTKCKIIMRQTVELEMKRHKAPRTTLAPPFYNMMIDIAYGFRGQPFKNARKQVDIYALVMVCLLTGATSIIALEGIETQDVVSAIQTHSCLHGVPAEVFVDNGSQLKALKHASFSLRDADTRLFDALGLRITVSNAKSHEEQGRVERKIGLLRDMLQRLTAKGTLSLSGLQWQAMFAMVANTIDNLPLAKGNTSNSSELGFEILTANRLKLGRNNFRSLAESGVSVDMASGLTEILDRNREIQHAWYQIFIDHIHLLTVKPPKWDTNGRLPRVDDIVLFVMDDSGHGKKGKTWRLGKVLAANKSRVTIQYSVGDGRITKASKAKTLERNPRDVSILFSSNELTVNSSQYFQKTTSE